MVDQDKETDYPPDLNPEDIVIEKEEKQVVRDAIDKLSPQRKDTVEKMFGFEGGKMTAKEIAEERGTSTISVYQQRRNALFDIRNQLELQRLREMRKKR